MRYRYDHSQRPGRDPEIWKAIVSIAAVAVGIGLAIGALYLIEML